MEMYKIIFFDDNIRFIEDFVGTWFQLMKKIIILEKAGFNNVSYIPIGYVFPEIYFKRKQVDSSRTYYE